MASISVNGRARPLPGATSVAALVLELTGRDQPSGVAVALNGQLVRRGDWAETPLRDGDAVEVLGATAGG